MSLMDGVVWCDLPFGAVLRRKDDGETVMITRSGPRPPWMHAVSLVLPSQGLAEGWTIRPGDAVAPFIYGCNQWERVE